MIFPTLALWSSPDSQDALGRIDRALNDRNHRLSAGISISNRFDQIRGALVVSQGNGRYVRVRHVVDASAPITKSLRNGCLEFVSGKPRDFGELSLLLAELADSQAAVVEQLKCKAGKYLDRVLAVSVRDPGVWTKDFDGQISYAPMCDATRLAELSGVTVIDAFPARDLAVGGQGTQLEALPNWILFADRNPKVANQSRALITLDDRCRSYTLPASDGLDADVPMIRMAETIGIHFLDGLSRRYLRRKGRVSELDRLYADGRQIPELRERWEKALESPGEHAPAPRDASLEELSARMVDVGEAYLKETSNAFSNVIRTGIRWVIDQAIDQLDSNPKPHQLLVSCPEQFEASVINQLTHLMPSIIVTPTRQVGLGRDQADAVVAAILGLFHIDQMPANVPWLTGASCQRILGRITPGRPSNWRQLVRIMADFHPAPMKLKDVI
jgi:anhydro-N-acetylmuramic acid kinase